MNNWNWNLDELVDKVMSDLRSSDARLNQSSSVSAKLTRDFRSIQSKRPKGNVSQASSAFVASNVDVAYSDKQDNEVFELAERVIFLEIVKKFASQTSCRRWKICSNAVVTPSAKDELKKRKIELLVGEGVIRSDGSNRSVVSCGTSRQSRVTLSASNMLGSSWDAPKNLTEDNWNQTKIYLANHLSEVENIPLNVREYLACNSSLTEVRFSCLKEASRQIQSVLVKDKLLKVILTTHDGAIASVWCNRLTGVRAVAAFSYDQVCDDLKATGANVVIVDPYRVGAYQFKRIVSYYLRSEIK